MRVLIVISGNSSSMSPFVMDQVDALKKYNVKVEYFLIKGKGIFGYAKNYNLLLEKIKSFNPDLVHAHYGLSGLLSSLQRKVPTVITFHGSDINDKRERKFSNIANKLCSRSIFVSYDLANLLDVKDPIVIPCGVDLDVFYPVDKREARIKIGMSLNKKYILFSSSFSNSVKNFPLAKEGIGLLKNNKVELLELKGCNREEVALLLNAVDLALLTSFTEGSPQFIKEALSCNTPIVSTDVGDVNELINNVEGCYLSKSNPKDISVNIQKALIFDKKTSGRNNIKRLDNNVIAAKIISVYKSVLNN